MTLRSLFMPWFRRRGHLLGLLEHYEVIAKGRAVIEEALRGYLADGACRAFQVMTSEIDSLEVHADKIKRRIRNHLPRAFFMEVDKTLFLNYTSYQDNILDAAQESLAWLGMRHMQIPGQYHDALLSFGAEVTETVGQLKSALEATIALIYHDPSLRADAKEKFHIVRDRHIRVARLKRQLVAAIYDSEMEFKDIYQLLKFVECMHVMSHNAEGCANCLRAMIAR